MSPCRKIDPTADEFAVVPNLKRRRPWGTALVAGVTAVLIAAAIAASTLILVSHQQHRRQVMRDVAVLGYVREFVAEYTSLDPLRANAYAERIRAQATGDFAKAFRQKENEILLAVARGEPTWGTVQEAALEKWNDDGSADVLVATEVATKSPDGKTVVESGNRWLVTAIEKGRQWKISRLVQVI
jgi:Mce-associated membrane protein